MNYCELHNTDEDRRVAWYVAKDRYFCETCRPIAVSICMKESLRLRVSQYDPSYDAPRSIKRRNEAIVSCS